MFGVCSPLPNSPHPLSLVFFLRHKEDRVAIDVHEDDTHLCNGVKSSAGRGKGGGREQSFEHAHTHARAYTHTHTHTHLARQAASEFPSRSVGEGC